MALAMATVLDPGDEVVFVSPPWFFYEALILGAGATPVRVRADETTWDLDVDAIARALTLRTRMVLINTPNNPTGRIYPDETLARLGEALERRSNEAGRAIYLLSDEAYSKILFDGNVMRSPARHYDRTLLVHTFSKGAFVQRLAQDKVLAMPGNMFEMPGYFRLSLTATDDMVERAIPVFEKAISDTR